MSQREAAQELLKRRTARRSLLAFTEYTKSDFQPGDHHRVICDALEQVERGEIDRLIIEAPPRHSKSLLATRQFPAWFLGRNSAKQIITASYGKDLSTDFGRDVRDLVASPAYQRLFHVALRADVKAASKWHTSNGGVYNACAVGSATTGLGGHILICDDPIKNREEADSQKHRDKIWRWYTSTFYTRLMPGGAIVIILTRWHEDDLAGRLLAQEDGDTWHRVRLPAITNEHTDNEQALWPGWYPLDALHRIRKQLTAGNCRDWHAMYQQEPTQEQGTYFQREWFQRYKPSELPSNLHKYGASDYAVSEGQGDFTEHGVFGVDAKGNLYVVDWWSRQSAADAWIDAMLDLWQEHKPFAWFGESGVIEKAIAPLLSLRIRERRVFCRAEWLPSMADKTIRARAFQAMAAQGRVFVPSTPEGDRLIEQLVKFPSGKFDDAVDVCSLMGRAIDQAHPAIVKREEPAQLDRWARLSRQQKQSASSGDWKTA